MDPSVPSRACTPAESAIGPPPPPPIRHPWTPSDTLASPAAASRRAPTILVRRAAGGLGVLTVSLTLARPNQSVGVAVVLGADDVELSSSWTSTWSPLSSVTSISYLLSSSSTSEPVTRPRRCGRGRRRSLVERVAGDRGVGAVVLGPAARRRVGHASRRRRGADYQGGHARSWSAPHRMLLVVSTLAPIMRQRR